MKIAIRLGLRRILFKRRIEPRTCDVPATFLWRISDVSVLVWNFSFVRRIKVYVLRRACDVCVAYEAYA